ncbi:transposase [Caballeronia choica]|nr:transposase [Caballeronia choica]
MAGRWQHRANLFGHGTSTASGRAAQAFRHSRRRHDDCSEERRRQPRVSGHKHLKGCKAVAFCDRHCNIIAPFVTAPGNRNESPLLRHALPRIADMARAIGPDLRGSTVSLDGGYDCRDNRRAIFNRGMTPNIPD